MVGITFILLSLGSVIANLILDIKIIYLIEMTP